MNFRNLMSIAAVITVGFGLYLLWYGGANLWGYRELLPPDVTDKDAHGMSRLVGYTFICMFGVVISGLGSLICFSRNITDAKARQSVTLGLFTVNAVALMLSLVLQILYWSSGWGQFYITTFLLLTLLFGYSRFGKLRGI